MMYKHTLMSHKHTVRQIENEKLLKTKQLYLMTWKTNTKNKMRIFIKRIGI